MATETLQTDLLAVPGVASAEVETTNGAAPAGVKVRLAPDADARRVGIEVQRVLAAHGMRSRFSAADQSEPVPPSPPGPPAAPKAVPAPPAPVLTPPVVPPPVVPAPSAPIQPPPPMAMVPNPPTIDPPQVTNIARLRSVAVEERSDGLTALVVLDDGRQAARVTGALELDSAVVSAAVEAAGRAATLVVVEWIEVDQGSVATVVLQDVDGALLAGAAVLRVGRAFAVGSAAITALGA